MARAEARLRARLKLPASLIDRTHSRSAQGKAEPAAVATRTVKNVRNPKPRRPRTRGRGSPQ
jgi:hypothetical protein